MGHSSSLGAFRGGRWAIPALLLAVLGAPSEVRGQGEGCDVPAHGGLVMTTLSNDTRMFFFQTPTIRCPGGVTISADSARVYESTSYNQLWGNVVFQDRNSRLTADRAQYFSDEGRLTAQDNAVLTTEEGSVIRGDEIRIFRAGSEDEEDQLIVTGRRPHATLYPARVSVEEVVSSSVAGGDEPVAMPDTAAAGAATVDPDSASVLPDSLALVPDSAVTAPDSVPVPPDSLMAPADSIVVLDPGAVLQDSLAPPPDSAVSGELPSQAAPEPEVPRVPYEIDAGRFDLEGERYFRASGSVVVTRDSLRAEADSLEYDQEEGALRLNRSASVKTAQTDLAADAIRLDIPQDDIREALARGRAVLEGKDLRLLAPIVTLFFSEGTMERLVAQQDLVADSILAEMDEDALRRQSLLGGGLPQAAQDLGFEEFPRRPYALAQDFILEGDSLEVLTPGEVLREVKAMGAARGESSGLDSMNVEDTPPLIARDWLEGDTIVAFFQDGGDSLSALGESSDSLSAPGEPGDSLSTVAGVAVDPGPEAVVLEPEYPAPDTGLAEADTAAATYRLQRLVAKGRARSMYRMTAADSVIAQEPGRLAIHYVVGDEIIILLSPDGQAERMEVAGQTRGIHLEPLGKRGVEVDSLAVDTILVPDTSVVRRPGGGSGR